MKLKYKKLIILVSLATMFLSFIILSMIPTGGESPADPQNAELTKGENEKINELIKAYFKAKEDVNMDAMSELVSDITQINEKKLRDKAAYEEAYENIVCHIIANEEQNAYRVYVQYDVKIANINTLAPSLSALYVKLASDDKYLVYLSALDQEEDDFINAADKNMDVIKLKEDTEKRFQAAKASDPALKQFCEMIDKDSAQAPQQGTVPQQSTQPTQSAAPQQQSTPSQQTTAPQQSTTPQ